MSKETRITQRQEAVLRGYTCQRLTADPGNLAKAASFKCRHNANLAESLSGAAWREDQEGRPTVYYVVKSPRGTIALYFSLKCGVLFDPNYVRDVVDRFERSRERMDALEGGRTVSGAEREAIRSGYRVMPRYMRSRIRREFIHAKNEKQTILADAERDPNTKLIRVDEAFPAIELVHFVANDNARAEWKSYNMGHSMGACLFWYFVVPKMMEINNMIGCEYAYLFAADSSPDGNLMNYYETALHFRRMEHIGAIKPQYDFLCVFMGARLSRLTPYRRECMDLWKYDKGDEPGLFEHWELFFENFNLTPGVPVV